MEEFNNYANNSDYSYKNGHKDDENVPHLAKFLIAKKSASKIFSETESFMKDVYEFYKNFNFEEIPDFQKMALLEELTGAINRIKVIKTILMRDSMKVAFFGRTSNGKSTVINAMLGRSILPSGIGHTTSCFVSMRGTKDKEPYIVAPESPEKRSVNDLKALASAISNTTLGPNNLISVYWPAEKCPILEHQVSFLDSPGVDVDHDLDTWINQYCRDADVFVLVVNSESTLNNSEKKFFLEVKKHISSPNIFILNNRWDASTRESEIEAIKAQHLKRCVDFLSKELDCVSLEEAIERVYFTSAQEALYYKTKSTSQNSYIENSPGYMERVSEFLKFEDKLQRSLYRSAISTKFSSHCSQADSLLSRVAKQLEKFISSCKAHQSKIQGTLKHLVTQKEKVSNKLASAFYDFDKNITSVSKLIQQTINSLLVKEVRNFNEIVQSFDYPFHSDPKFLETYKKELLHFISSKFEESFFLANSSELLVPVDKLRRKMIDFAKHVAIDENDFIDISKIESEFSIDWYHHFDINSTLSDFSPDISFKFFFNPLSLVRWFVCKLSPSNISQTQELPGSGSIEKINECPEDTSMMTPPGREGNNDSLVAAHVRNPQVQQSIDDLSSTITTSTCIFIGMGARIVGYRMALYVSAFVVSVFAVKWLMWTESAKRDSYLKQFVFFSEKRLIKAFNVIGIQNSRVVERVLNTLLSDIKSSLEAYYAKLETDIKTIELKIKNLESVICKSQQTRHKCLEIQACLNSFCINYELNIKKFEKPSPPLCSE